MLFFFSCTTSGSSSEPNASKQICAKTLINANKASIPKLIDKGLTNKFHLVCYLPFEQSNSTHTTLTAKPNVCYVFYTRQLHDVCCETREKDPLTPFTTPGFLIFPQLLAIKGLLLGSLVLIFLLGRSTAPLTAF